MRKILHSNYIKPIATRYVVNRDSAFQLKSKINILVADLVRVMEDVSPLLENRTQGTFAVLYTYSTEGTQ